VVAHVVPCVLQCAWGVQQPNCRMAGWSVAVMMQQQAAAAQCCAATAMAGRLSHMLRVLPTAALPLGHPGQLQSMAAAASVSADPVHLLSVLLASRPACSHSSVRRDFVPHAYQGIDQGICDDITSSAGLCILVHPHAIGTLPMSNMSNEDPVLGATGTSGAAAVL